MKEALIKKKKATFELVDLADFKARALQWSKSFTTVALLDNNLNTADKYHSQEYVLAVGVHSELKIGASKGDSFFQLRAYYDQVKDWIFGFLTYDLKNDLEDLSSKNTDNLEFPLLHFFQPQHLLKLSKQSVEIQSFASSPELLLEEILATPITPPSSGIGQEVTINACIPKAEYLEKVATIKQHIVEGDIYEMNFCQEFYVDTIEVNPYALFTQLNALGNAPFSVFYRHDAHYLMCSSPERFLKKEQQKIISQPIKGTTGRSNDLVLDQELRSQLLNSEKDRAENVMIVDLVRNDLARTCKPGSVKVEELFGIYAFPQVYQMISTVVGALKDTFHPVDAIAAAFPMGSMTGAPKVMSMELIEKYEKSKRGLYSGAVGYFTPDGDFDFNVVIRSLLYNADKEYLSFQVGGAIVYDSVPELEYEECLLKAKGIMEVLGAGVDNEES